MTREEAIERLEWYQCHAETEEDADAFDMAISALRPVSRERVENLWRGEWEDMREAYNDVPKRRCSRCKSVFIGFDTPFCDACGAPMTDEAVDMVMEKLKKVIE